MNKFFVKIVPLAILIFGFVPALALAADCTPQSPCCCVNFSTNNYTSIESLDSESWCRDQEAGNNGAFFMQVSCDEAKGESVEEVKLLQQQSSTPMTADEAAEQANQAASSLKTKALELNPIGISGPTDIFTIAINVMMAFMGSIALLLYIWAGFLWMSAGGNSERVDKAKSILVWTTLGVVAIGASYMLINTVLQKIG